MWYVLCYCSGIVTMSAAIYWLLYILLSAGVGEGAIEVAVGCRVSASIMASVVAASVSCGVKASVKDCGVAALVGCGVIASVNCEVTATDILVVTTLGGCTITGCAMK